MRWWTALVASACLVLAGCGEGADGGATNSDKIKVVASFYPIAEAAIRVGGERVEVTNLTPAGTEPHDLELTADQVDHLEDADLVVYLGQGFQPAVEAVAERRDGRTVDLLAKLPLRAGAVEELAEEEDADDEGGQEVDPHFWLNPTLLSEAAGIIESELSALADGAAGSFGAGLDSYQGELAALDQEFEAALSSCERTEIVTSHAAFFYLADRFGLTQVPIAGLSPESEPDAQRIADLTTLIAHRGITTVFYETLVSPAVAQTLAREAEVDAAVLDPIEGLSEDALSAGKDYSAVMLDNLTALRSALGCP